MKTLKSDARTYPGKAAPVEGSEVVPEPVTVSCEHEGSDSGSIDNYEVTTMQLTKLDSTERVFRIESVRFVQSKNLNSHEVVSCSERRRNIEINLALREVQ